MASSGRRRVVVLGGTYTRQSMVDWQSPVFFSRGMTRGRLQVALKGPILGVVFGTGLFLVTVKERTRGGALAVCGGSVTSIAVAKGQEKSLDFDITGDELALFCQFQGTNPETVVSGEVSAQGYLEKD